MDLGEFYQQNTLPNLTEGLPPQESLPETIGPYKIEALLSKGGMSLLYLGIHPDKHTPLAIKVLSPHFVKNLAAIQQFLKEAKIIALSDHPNIVKLYGQGEWEHGLYIAMEFIRGISLKQFILQNSLSIKRSLEILLQVAYALLHLHTHGVIHRDLKPENILITEDGSVKVIDFGIAQLAHEESKGTTLESTLHGGIIGTPSYMSPEQKKDPLHVSYSTDIYSLGVIAYELLIGKLSFGKIQLSYLPSSLQPIIQKAIAPLQQDRYEDIVELISALSLHLKSLHTTSSAPHDNHEFVDMLEKLQKPLTPPPLPPMPTLSIGISQAKELLPFGTFYDILKFANGNLLIIMAEPFIKDPSAITHIALLKGIIHGMLTKDLHQISTAFTSLTFVSSLNEVLHQHSPPLQYAFSSLYLDQKNHQFTYLSCGFDALYHLSAESAEPHVIRTDNPLLGSAPQIDFFEAIDNWSDGDCLVFHTFNSLLSTPPSSLELDPIIVTHLAEYPELSAQHQSEKLLEQLLQLPSFTDEHLPHLVIAIENLF